MTKGLPLKRNVSVSPVVILVMQISDKIFHEVPDVKKQKPHFELLPQVNAFMVKELFLRPFIFHKNKRIKRHPRHPQGGHPNHETFETRCQQ